MDPLYRPRTLLALATTVLLWGSAFPVVRALLLPSPGAPPSFPPAELALLRYGIASLILGALAAFMRPPLPRRADLPRLAAIAAVGICLYNLAVNDGSRTVSAGPGSFIVNTAPLFSALIAVTWLGERLRLAGWVGMITSLGGIALIAAGEGHGLTLSSGVAEMACAAILWSFYTVLQKPLLPHYGALALVCYVAWIGTLMLSPCLPSALSCLQTASRRDGALLAYLAIGPSAIAFTTWSYAVAQVPVTRVMPFLYAVPLVALVVGWTALGERPTPLSLAGCLFIITGLVIVNTVGARSAARTPALPDTTPPGAPVAR
jgi:drug/metabolite transporter (DMT)-like permease